MSYMKQMRKGMLPYALAAATLAYTTPQSLRAEEPKAPMSIEQLLNDVSGIKYDDSKLIQLAANYQVVPGETTVQGKSYKNQELYNHWRKSMTDEQIKASKYGKILQEKPDLSHLNSQNKPVYKKAGFWWIVGGILLAVGIGVAVAASGSKGEDKKDNNTGGTPSPDPDGNDPNQPNI